MAEQKTIHKLTRNAGGHQIGETFTSEDAKKSGISAENFSPPLPEGKVVDRAIKSPA